MPNNGIIKHVGKIANAPTSKSKPINVNTNTNVNVKSKLSGTKPTVVSGVVKKPSSVVASGGAKTVLSAAAASSPMDSFVGYYSAQGPRDYMEDTHQIMHFTHEGKKGTFYGVFDGHGGSDVSKYLIHPTDGLFPFLIGNIKKYKGHPVSKILKAGFLAYDHLLFKKKLKAGSTACVVLLYDSKLFIANLGDSRVMAFLDNDTILKISQDHKPWLTAERNRIYKAGCFVNPFKIYYTKSKKSYDNGDIYVDTKAKKNYLYLEGEWQLINEDQYKQILNMNNDYDTHRVCNSLALSRSFGDFYLKVNQKNEYMGSRSAVSPEPDIEVVNLKPHKDEYLYILLGSDGFWDVNNITKGLKQFIRSHPNPKNMCQELVEESFKKGSMDNITVVCDKIKA